MIGKTDGRMSRTASKSLCIMAVTLLAVVSLTACEDKPTAEAIDQHAVESRRALDSVMMESPSKHYNPLVVTDKIWTGGTALRMQRGLPLPPRYETPRGIALVSAEPMTLNDIASAITTQTGIIVRLLQNGAAGQAAAPTPTGPGGQPAAGAANNAMPVAYEGPLSGLLERVSGHFGMNWHYNGATIEISRYETRIFVIEALPGTEKIEEGMQDASSGTSAGASAASTATQTSTITQNSKTSIDMKYWDELGQTLTSMIAGNGTVVLSPSLGTVAITTTPETMRTVAQYLAEENQRLSRQIAINVEIYIVSLQNDMDFNFAFQTAINKIANNFLGNITGITPPTDSSGFTGAANLNLAILNPNNTSQSQVSAIVTALAALGNTTTVAKFPLVTLNNRPVSRRIGQQISYVASATQTQVSGGTAATSSISLTPGTVPEGFTVQVTPRLLDDGRILIEYSLSDISIVDIKTFNSQCGDVTGGTSSGCSTSGSTSIQSPDTVERVFVQQSVLKSGSTLILGGAEEEDLTQDKQGIADPDFWGLGGGIVSSKTHTMVFFAITPQALDVPHTEQE